MQYVTINRDPFARCDLIRTKVSKDCECSWCGQKAKFYYGVHRDGIYAQPEFKDKPFCGIGCYRDFYSLNDNQW
jgi:hypothetical protein